MSSFSANQPMTESRPGGMVSTALRPELFGPEGDAEFAANIADIAGPASSEPFSATLGGLIASWFGSVGIADDGSLTGRQDGHHVPVTADGVLDLLRRSDLGAQLGIPVDRLIVERALVVTRRQATAENERQAVADDARADQQRAALVGDAERSEQRARLLRELASLDQTVAPIAEVRPVPVPPLRGWRKR